VINPTYHGIRTPGCVPYYQRVKVLAEPIQNARPSDPADGRYWPQTGGVAIDTRLREKPEDYFGELEAIAHIPEPVGWESGAVGDADIVTLDLREGANV
jgi:hypothetical protein